MSRFAVAKASYLARVFQPGNLSKVSKRRMSIVILVVLAVAVILGVAWYDGGREEQRLIVEPVTLPEGNR